ncbi:cyclin-dependent kinase-like 4 isoform X2 [Macrosteles quadrilineatus]|uniref:cyclin-dependent kinase-like 4 isoform X2 n=1 Tax=Macrosteles quadrilineatus TaxID=74068 RepID=UPI0023E11749|nr:cyclin-dependent kinase-like 4 isoform X2 [Macrosteles quadrilineatus]XP_054269761.1 cyclin-dependent kinase-like 4 isoform X2 [Macrosteles quadrilineatus]
MEKYESIGVVGEGSYGIVMKCRHKESGTIVAIKKFIETEDDHNVRKMALREIRMLKKLHHDNLVNMIEVFRRKRRFYLVFEFMDHTVLDELEENPKGLGDRVTRQHMFQVIRGIDFCHKNNIVHRDVKPENILVSNQGVIKLCDFGFARLVSSGGETYTDYVATRWYRAPELLVGDTRYGRPVDIWAIGCLFAELMSGDPLFPGESDIDQLYQIMKLLGKLCTRHQQLIAKNPLLKEMRKSNIEYADELNPSRCLYKLFPSWPSLTLEIVALCLRLDPSQRPTSSQLLQHSYFTHDRFAEFFAPELRKKVEQEFQGNPLLSKIYLQLVDTSLEKKGSAELGPPRRSSQVEPPRWKMNYGGNTSMVERQQTLRDLDGISMGKRLTLDCGSPMEIGGDDDVGENNNNVKFLNKYSPLLGSLKPLHDNNPQHHSLTPTTLSLHTEPQLPTPQHSLHPAVTVSNISLSYRNDNNSKKSIGPPKPGMGVVPRAPVVRKLEQRLTMDMEPRPAWRPRGPLDDFSLPNLPGASLSPHKINKKKLNPVHSHGNVDSFISPAILHANPNKMRYWIRPAK